MVSLILPLSSLSTTEEQAVQTLANKLSAYRSANDLKTRYYEGTERLKDLGISIPPEMKQIETVIGWPGTVVDVYEERLDWLGWVSARADDYGLGEVYSKNQLGSESSMAHLDSLIYGVSFVATGSGDADAGEPDVLVTVESPMTMTVEWSRRGRRVTKALGVNETGEDGQPTSVTLYQPDQTIRLAKDRGGVWRVVHRDDHNLGLVTVSRLVNRPWGAHRQGRSEITRAVRALTDNAVRTLLGSEVAREFYSAPQRWIMGASAESFEDADGNPLPAWQSYLGRFLALEGDGEGNLPSVGQFAAANPTPYWESIRGLAQLLSAEAGIPVAYLGLVTDNPASADAIKALESRTLKRSERRHTQLGAGWKDTAAHVLMVRDGSPVVPDRFAEDIECQWRDPATPTRSAAADSADKLVNRGILLPDSTVTWDLVGLSPSQQKRLAADHQRARIEAFGADVDQAEELDIKARADALGVLIRAGVDPTDAAERVGLTGAQFTGAVPVSLRQPEDKAGRLEDK